MNEVPLHIDPEFTDTVGDKLTDTEDTTEFVQPATLDPVTV